MGRNGSGRTRAAACAALDRLHEGLEIVAHIIDVIGRLGPQGILPLELWQVHISFLGKEKRCIKQIEFLRALNNDI